MFVSIIHVIRPRLTDVGSNTLSQCHGLEPPPPKKNNVLSTLSIQCGIWKDLLIFPDNGNTAQMKLKRSKSDEESRLRE